MSAFRRNYSKVWWANYFHEDANGADDHNVVPISSQPASLLQFNRRRSTGANNSNRNSSGSPSNGSQKSQDSGFSDSESSSPSSCSSKTTNSDNQSVPAENHTETLDGTPTGAYPESSPVRLPQTPLNRVPRPLVIKSRQNESTKLEIDQSNNLVSTYLNDCYFPVATGVMLTPYVSQLPRMLSCPPSLPDEDHSAIAEGGASHSPQNWKSANRTCFIVDEIPKKTPTKNGSPSSKYDDMTGSTDTSFSLSYDDTVRFVEKKGCQSKEEEYVEAKSIAQQSSLQINTIKMLEANESRMSIPDLNHLPEPAFTSTPKKEGLQIPKRFNEVAEPSSLEDKVVEKNETVRFVDPPVARWLFELQRHYEVECMIALQAKRIPQYYQRKSSDILMASESMSSLRTFQQQTKIIVNEFLNLYENISLRMCERVNSQLCKLISSIKEFIINYSQLLPRMESIEKENVLRIMDMCDHFQKLFNPFDQQTLLNDLNLLEKFFSRFVDSILVQQIMFLISELDNPTSEVTLLNSLHCIAALNLNTSRTLDLVTRLDGIQKLLIISLQSSSSDVRKAALRALTVVCQNASSIRQLERARGIEIISEILCDVERDESELSEIISVLVQITAPWIEDDHVIRGLIYYLYPVLNAITRLIAKTSSCETLLLCAAALANLTFIEPQAVYILVKLDTAGCLLTAVRKLGVRVSVFLQEQVATLIVNMAAEPDTRTHLAQHRAVGALLCFLQVKHFPLQNDAEVAAAERLQHKSAVALSRLCSNSEIAKQVVELQGVSRLVRLCREERERNYSDGVLVACLTSLRKITANCGNDSIIDLNAKELVEPRLVDSFLMYSSKQESYV